MPRERSFPLPQPVFGEPVFAEGVPTPDPSTFKVPHPSDAQLYQQIQALLSEDVVGFPAARGAPGDLYELASALGPHGPEVIAALQATGQIVFHMAGDIGASSQRKYPGELSVADRLAQDAHSVAPPAGPAFLYLLGDLIYDFGEAQYYFDQFYEPYRNYPGPIFAIPGNHDSFIVPGTAPAQAPLVTFQRNFCAASPVVTAEAGSLHRTAMTQPGVYFTLDAPFVRIIGLFSNALEDPGVLSSEQGTWATVPDLQLAFLAAQLARIKSDRFTGAVLLATHHPPFCYAPPAGAGGGGFHGGSPRMLADIDRVCAAQGVYPHAFLAGHAHNYQRFTRSIAFGGGSYQVPFLICGGGGHDISPLVQTRLGSPAVEPVNGIDVSYLDTAPVVSVGGLRLERHDDQDYGYLRVVATASQLRLEFHSAGQADLAAPASDVVTVDLASHTMMPSGGVDSR